MWRSRVRRRAESICTQARIFLACWDISTSTGDELRLHLRDRVLTLTALKGVMERAARCGGGTRFVFDFSGVEDMESCYSVISALFIRFSCQVGKRCRITGLNPRLAKVMAYFFRRMGCVELELARRPARAAS